MSESSNERTDGPGDQQDEGVGISDEQLPDELLPSEDNPLAEPLSDEEAPDDIDELDMMGSGSSGSEDSDESDEAGEETGGSDAKATDGEPPSSDDQD
jgi:hypothetical protein